MADYRELCIIISKGHEFTIKHYSIYNNNMGYYIRHSNLVTSYEIITKMTKAVF